MSKKMLATSDFEKVEVKIYTPLNIFYPRTIEARILWYSSNTYNWWRFPGHIVKKEAKWRNVNMALWQYGWSSLKYCLKTVITDGKPRPSFAKNISMSRYKITWLILVSLHWYLLYKFPIMLTSLFNCTRSYHLLAPAEGFTWGFLCCIYQV